MEDIKMKEDLRSCLSEYINDLCGLFRNGYPSVEKRNSKDILLPAVSFFAGLIIASAVCFLLDLPCWTGPPKQSMTLRLPYRTEPRRLPIPSTQTLTGISPI
jgi:hypothetical protein